MLTCTVLHKYRIAYRIKATGKIRTRAIYARDRTDALRELYATLRNRNVIQSETDVDLRAVYYTRAVILAPGEPQ